MNIDEAIRLTKHLRADRIAAAQRALTEARLALSEAEARVRWCAAVAKDAAIALDKARVGDGDE